MINKITVAEDFTLVRLSGSLYSEEAAQIRESLIGYIEKGHKNLIIDLGGVDYIDKYGWVTFVAVHKQAMQSGGSVVIKGTKGIVKDSFEMIRLDKVFAIKQ